MNFQLGENDPVNWFIVPFRHEQHERIDFDNLGEPTLVLNPGNELLCCTLVVSHHMNA